MLTIDPSEIPVPKMYGYIVSTVVPRPIAFASTVDGKGNVNLSPYSFFNAFSSRPPILIFSPVTRVRDETDKDTLENVREVPEVVVNIVSHHIVEQMSLTSTEYDRNVNEFVKSGLTELPSERVKPPRVAEAYVQFECKVIEIKPLGNEGGAGNLVICEILLAHFADEVVLPNGKIDAYKLNPVGRMGGALYTNVDENTIFEIARPSTVPGIGVDQIPKEIRLSDILTGNDLARLGTAVALPQEDEVKAFAAEADISRIMETSDSVGEARDGLHRLAQRYLKSNDVDTAWKVLLQEI